MKSVESRLRELEALMAKRNITRLTKTQRDQAVKKELQRLKTLTPEKLEEALQASRDNRHDGIVASQEQREAAVRAAFNSLV
jgi:hypothetical protein